MGVAWSPARREAMRAKAMARGGAPTGFCTIYGVHAPEQYQSALRYFTQRIANKSGRASAEKFVVENRDNRWADMPDWHRLWVVRNEFHQTERLIKNIRREAAHGN